MSGYTIKRVADVGDVLGDYPGELDRVRAKVGSFAGMVGGGDQRLPQWTQRLLISGAADLSARRRAEYLSAIDATIDRQVLPRLTIISSAAPAVPARLSRADWSNRTAPRCC